LLPGKELDFVYLVQVGHEVLDCEVELILGIFEGFVLEGVELTVPGDIVPEFLQGVGFVVEEVEKMFDF
jgi:hypothetical protein